MEDVVKQCGRPDEEIGGDDYVFVYHFAQRGMASITTASLKNIQHVDFQYQDTSWGRNSPQKSVFR